MKHVALLVVALGATGCKAKETTQDKPMVASGSTVAGSAGSDESYRAPGQYKMTKEPNVLTNFARFDEALLGVSPWITDDEVKAGIVELIAEKGTPTTKRLCGDAAKKSADTIGAAFTKRATDAKHDPARCITNSDNEYKLVCVSIGVGEGDVTHYAEYWSSAGKWRLVGVQTVADGVNKDKQDEVYAKLQGDKCK